MGRVAREMVVGVLAVALHGQTEADRSHFEVASIRAVGPNAPFGYKGPETGDFGRIVISRLSLKLLIADAYPQYLATPPRVSGPPWIENEYAVSAILPPRSSRQDVARMMQNLLVERFGLKFHDVEKDVAGFELEAGESGIKLMPSAGDEGAAPAEEPRGRVMNDKDGFPILKSSDLHATSYDREQGVIRVTCRRCSMKALANLLSDYSAGVIPVVDKTGVAGFFDFRLTLPLSPFSLQFAQPEIMRDDVGGDLRGVSRLLEQQTGLRLKSRKLRVHTMVIDHLDRAPSEN